MVNIQILLVLLLVPCAAQRCMVGAGWQRLSMGERLVSAHSVVYGRTVQHLSTVRTFYGQDMSVIDAMFEIFCIIKSGGENFPEVILIEGIAPRDGCSGSRGNMQIGQEAFIALTPTSEGNYEFDEVMPVQSAVFPATRTNFEEISSICGLQSWSSPRDVSANKCPVCGVANFTNAVLGEDETSSFACIVDGELVSGNASICDVILTTDTPVQETCIPRTYDSSCISLSFTVNQVNCVCASNTNREGSFANVSGAERRRFCVLYIAAGILVLTFLLKF